MHHHAPPSRKRERGFYLSPVSPSFSSLLRVHRVIEGETKGEKKKREAMRGMGEKERKVEGEEEERERK